ncbi:hypothetical protein DFP72DRAFT_878331 [Ephemerocybe angulata]|nr:hypothetical protein DFP72DRAFT_878331 [Tulosesus angulatus]
MNIHTGLKPHHCIYCDQAFADPSSKARHEKETHRCTGTYKCPATDCPVGIKRRSAFVVHLKDKHGLTKKDVDIDSCAPALLPKPPRKSSKKSMVLGATRGVSAKPGAQRLSGRTIAVPVAPPMVPLYEFIEASSSKFDASPDSKEIWQLSEHRHKAESQWDTYHAVDQSPFGYADPETLYQPPPPSYHTSNRDGHHLPAYSSPAQLSYPDATHYPAHSPGEATPQFTLSSSTDSSPATSKLLSSTQVSPRAMMPMPQLMPITQLPSRPVTPTHGLSLAYFSSDTFSYDNGKGSYSFQTIYSPAPGVHTIQG